MLKINIEIWPFGDYREKRLIKTITIANRGGTSEEGIYSLKLFKEGFNLPEDDSWYEKYKANEGVEQERNNVKINRKQPIQDFILEALSNF